MQNYQKRILRQPFFLVLLLAMLTVVPVASFAQELAGAQRASVVERISSASSSVKALQCTFVQTKRSKVLKQPVVSEGVMAYRAPSYLRWEYTAPESVVITVEGDSVSLIRKGVKADAATSRRISSLATTILGCVSGTQVWDEKSFKVSIVEKADSYVVELEPRRRGLKRMFQHIDLHFDKKSYAVRTVVLAEGSDASTTIKFTPVK